jgi:hypothetical protein
MSELQDFNQRVIHEFRANQGKVSGQLANMPVLLLTMTGAKSGRTITKPLVYTTDGERLVVIASFAGAPKHPAWYHNLLVHPEATVEVGNERFREGHCDHWGGAPAPVRPPGRPDAHFCRVSAQDQPADPGPCAHTP